jgi:hypothetical protein
VAVTGSLVASNAEAGILLLASNLALDASAVLDTGRGVEALEISEAAVTASLVADNTEEGFAISASKLTLDASVVRDTKPDKSGAFGRGVQAQDGSEVTVTMSVLSGNTELGIGAAASKLAIDRSVIKDSKPLQDASLGLGVLLWDGSSGTIRGVLMRRNTTAGLMTEHLGSTATLDYSVVAQTRMGGAGATEMVSGDGLIATMEGSLDVLSCALLDNERSGAFYDHASGKFKGNVVSGDAWALVLQSAGVDWKDGGNDLECNEHPGKSNPGLPVLDLSDVAKLDPDDVKLPKKR